MPRTVIRRLFTGSICTSCRTKLRHDQAHFTKAFSTTTRKLADFESQTPPRQPQRSSNLSDLFSDIQERVPGRGRPANPPSLTAAFGRLQRNTATPYRNVRDRTTGLSNLVAPPVPSASFGAIPLNSLLGPPPEPHHFHIYCTKHNTHITLTRPNREPILSFSSGNIGFRKAQRGSYDAGFQLAAYVMKMIQDRGLLRLPSANSISPDDIGTMASGKGQEGAIQRLEVVIRGFGKGREAVVKALLGNEGRILRNRVVRISDATRLKFGGTRSPNPRRLG